MERFISEAFRLAHDSNGLVTLDIRVWFHAMTSSDFEFIVSRSIGLSLIFDSFECVDSNLIPIFIARLGNTIKEVHIKNCNQSLVSVLVQSLPTKNHQLGMEFCSLSWFNDKWLEAISKRFHGVLYALTIVSCSITNNGLFQLSKRCRKLSSFSLTNCNAVTDVGMVEILRNNCLSTISIQHSNHVSDLSIETLAQNSPNLLDVSINNAQQITNNGISFLHEVRKPVGNRRLNPCENVKTLHLNMLNSINSDIFLWICASMRSIVDIDLSFCPKLDFSRAFEELKHLNLLRDLKIGPTEKAFQPNDSTLDDVATVFGRLSTLVMHGIPCLEDDHLGYIFDLTEENFKSIVLEDIHCGTAFIESICSTQPSLPRITIRGSDIINDKDVRCLTSVCMSLRSLSVEKCGSITESAFTRLGNLRKLKEFSFQSKKMNVESSIMKYLVRAPLISLSLKGIVFSDFDGFLELLPVTISSLKKINLEHSILPAREMTAANNILNRFLLCESINLTNCDFANLENFRNLKHYNPFLRFEFSSEFLGFVTQSPSYFELHCQLRNVFQRHSAARAIQRQIRAWLKKIKDGRKRRRDNWKDLKTLSAIQIQALWRKCMAVRTYKHTIRAAKLITSCVVAVGAKIVRKKMQIAKVHHDYHSKRHVFSSLTSTVFETRRADDILHTLGIRIRNFHLMRRVFLDLLDRRELSRELRYIESAIVIREIRLLKFVLKGWRTCLNNRKDYRYLFSLKLMCVVPLHTWNSIRQTKLRGNAELFRDRKLLLKCWNIFAEVHNEKKRANLLVPIAVEHFSKTFFSRVMAKIFRGWALYKHQKEAIQRRRVEASNYFAAKQLCAAIVIWKQYSLLRQHLKECSISARSHWCAVKQKAAFRRYMYAIQLSFHLKESMSKAFTSHRHWSMEQGLINCYRGISSMRNWKRMNTKAELFNRSLIRRHSFSAWLIFRKFSSNLEAYYFGRYMNKQKRKVIRILMMNLGLRRNEKRQLLDFIQENSKNPEKCIHAIIRIQALARKHRAVNKFKENRVQKLFSIQVLQNFFRTMIARKEFGRRLKLSLLEETVREDHELEDMRDAEIEMRFFLYQLNAVITIQRCFRGWKGRIIAFNRAVEFYRDKSIDYYKDNHHMHQFHEMYLRAAIAREQLRHRSATMIEKVVRGMLCRKKFVGVKHQARVEKLAIVVQCAYRVRLAKLKLAALKRSYANDVRFTAARKQRGLVLRMFGLRTRGVQNIVAPVLRSLGIDPITFNYRIGELIDETIQDYHQFRGIVRRERALIKEHGYNRLNLAMGRRKVLATQGWKYSVQDAVKIVEPGHNYEGYTGTIVRIDETLLGIPLYEVKLDKFPKQTYVRMTADPLLAYLRFQSLAKITKNPTVTTNSLVSYNGENEGFPRTKENNRAATKIQNSFRTFRSRSITARKRYEHWLQNIDRHRSFLSHFSETNTLSSHGNLVAKMLGLKSHKEVYFDEMRHKIEPGRLKATVTKKNESSVIAKEFDTKLKDRTRFLQKSALIQAKDYFPVGYEKLTVGRKLLFAIRHGYGIFFKSGKSLQDGTGGRSKRIISRKESIVTGLDRYNFPQFANSPHVRYHKTCMYQGEWTGVPFFTALVPHGEGLIVFFDGWGFAREDKVLYLTIVRCRYLNAMDLTTSDPYCDIICNGINLQTSVKWENLNPDFHESFEIDVTNPMADLNIVVKDKDYFGSDDFMGQVVIPLKNYDDGKEHTLVMQLKGEDPKEEEDFDRGEIELRIRWAERLFEDDQQRLEIKNKMLIRIQSWARRISASNKLKLLRQDYIKNYHNIRLCAVKITCICRMRLAVKEFKRLSRNLKAAIKIQKRVRIWIAKKVFATKKVRKIAAIKIQSRMRVYLAKCLVARIKERNAQELDRNVTIIQKNARRFLAVLWFRRSMKEVEEEREKRKLAARMAAEEEGVTDYVEVETPRAPVSEWIDTYGVDPEYRLKRNRRITERLFNKILRTKYVRMVTKFGVVYNDSYPPRIIESDAPPGAEGSTPLDVNPNDFVAVFFPSFVPVAVRRAFAIQTFNKVNHYAILHLESSVDMRKTVNYNIMTIQCLVRQILARKKYAEMIRVHRAIAKFQRIFRKRYEKIHKASITITSLFRMISSKQTVRFLKREKYGAWTIQSAYRCYVARCKMFDLRSVDKLSVLKSSPSLENHGADKCLEHRSDTFWIADSPDIAELRVEFGQVEHVTQIWIMTSTFSASPNFVTIQTVLPKQKAFTVLVDKAELPLLKENRWHKFTIPLTETKYFYFTFYSNYGDQKYISIRQIRFLRSKESSAKITQQPSHFILDPGPSIGEPETIVLRCLAEGWPYPTYQWYKDDVPIPDATSQELKVTLFCKTYGTQTYRCLKCKMVSKVVPMNAYHVKCGNCSHLFTYKEVEVFDNAFKRVHEDESGLIKSRSGLLASKIQMESFNNAAKYRSVLNDIDTQLELIDEKMQVLREKRYFLKKGTQNCNHFTNEGIYTCVVQNIRGGSLKIKRKSARSVVVVERPLPFVLSVMPLYFPRVVVPRKKWSVYASMMSCFTNGEVNGLVLIRYVDGSFYEGPYVREEALDLWGETRPSFRQRDHFGVFYLPDGRIFEGSNVDNHFNCHNLQDNYRVRYPNGEQYEGNFCDENYHGIGVYTYKDGSVYEGNWYRGTRFGHGHLRSSDGSNYEGFFDRDRKHRQGVMDYPDGTCYIGHWYYDKIEGRGVMITPLRDVYRGDFVDGKFHGYGELFYADGSHYVGNFKNGFRHGPGIFTEKEGNQYFGNYMNDLQHGEHVVKVVIPIEEEGQDNYEIRVGLYDEGKLVTWKTKFSHPIATKQFITLFKSNREMFDSVYSMILAKNLPNLPEGIDANNENIKNIVFRIRLEAGMLVGQQALIQAQAQLNALISPLETKKGKISQLKEEIEKLSLKIVTLERESSDLHYKFSNMISRYEKDTSRIEQFWVDEPTQVRALFRAACKKLDTISIDEYFSFRNHRVVPVFVKKIFDCLSYLLDLPTEWKLQQMIIADSITNGRNGDEEALRLDYRCKLSYMMKDYRVYSYVNIKKLKEIEEILADVRFRSDSFYVESTGIPGPVLVEWIKTNFYYIKSAAKINTILVASEERKVEAFRYKAMYAKKKEEIEDCNLQMVVAQKNLLKAQSELEEIEHAVLKANDLLQFITGRFNFGMSEVKQDYYKLFERKLEEKRDLLAIEVCLQSAVDRVIERIDKEKRLVKLQAFATGKVLEDEELTEENISDWIRDEVRSQQNAVMSSGRTLGYGLEPASTDVSPAYTMQLVTLIADIVIGKFNDRCNDLASSRSWVSMKGRRFSSRFLYIMTWKIWEDEAKSVSDQKAISAWEAIFGDPQNCAIRAVEAESNHRMSSLARAQGKVWARHHPDEIRDAMHQLSHEFEITFESVEALSKGALDIDEDTTDTIDPSVKAKCKAWMKLHPDEVRNERDRQRNEWAVSFQEAFDNETGPVAVRILNGIANEEELEWAVYAQYWKEFNLEKYEAALKETMLEMARDFLEAYPISSHMEAATMIENDRIGKYIADPEVQAEYIASPKTLFNAYCWGNLNQGLLRKAKAVLRKNNLDRFQREWAEFSQVTDKFSKGSALSLSNEEIGMDRFAGFRNRLSNKHAWVYGYLMVEQENITKQLVDHEKSDPLGKVLHRVRPSKKEDIVDEIEKNFLARKLQMQQELDQIIGYIVTWNSYFGWRSG